MPFITFIYRIGRQPNTYYGKYCAERISDDHEGLDQEVRYELTKGLQAYRTQRNLPPLTAKIHIGVLSLSCHEAIPTYSSKREIKCFDFYSYYGENIYVNGKLVDYKY